MSETADGLQKCIDKLYNYCDKWGLQINIKKTKSVVFNKTGKLYEKIFNVNNVPIERARGYKYLGIYVSASGRFTEAKEDLYKRGLKALLKYKKSFNLYKPKINTLSHIFDHTVKPWLLYGSEIWGASVINKLNKNEHNLFKLCKDMKQESIHVKFCKFSMGLGKKSTNIAVLGEMGRYPLFLEVILNMLRYYKYILKSDDILLSEALHVSKSLNSLNKNSWYSCIVILMKYLDIDLKLVKNSNMDLKSLIYSKLKQKYSCIWKSELYNDRQNKQHGNKLRTYRLFKENICMEKYLLILNEDERRLLTKFRVSAHKLEIGRGRYVGLRVEDRNYATLKLRMKFIFFFSVLF